MQRSIKERIFGLTGNEGNHGEDVKEYYFYLDSTPSHSYMKYLYKYPQAEFPYAKLVEENRRRDKRQPEFELLDTGVFDEDRYFDVFVEYAKADVEDILIKITITNRGPEAANLRVLPTVWFRNTWSWGNGNHARRPKLHKARPAPNPVIELNLPPLNQTQSSAAGSIAKALRSFSLPRTRRMLEGYLEPRIRLSITRADRWPLLFRVSVVARTPVRMALLFHFQGLRRFGGLPLDTASPVRYVGATWGDVL